MKTKCQRAVEWNKNNTERRKEIANSYYQRNKDKHKKYRKENSEKIKKSQRAWYEKNKEVVLNRNTDWAKKNGKKVKIIKNRYYKKNKSLFLIYCNNRRTKENENGGYITLEQWNDLKSKFDYTCPMCKKREPEIILTIDHIVPISKGGSGWIYNIQPLCRVCNSLKSVKILKVTN